MSMEVFRACINGYSDHLFDLQILGVQQGYWAGYYTRSKKPKPFKTIIEKMFTSRKKQETTNIVKPEVDVEAFQEMEAQFNLRRKKYNK